MKEEAVNLNDSKEGTWETVEGWKGRKKCALHYNLKIIYNEKELSYMSGRRNCPEVIFKKISFYLYVVWSQLLIVKGSEYEN